MRRRRKYRSEDKENTERWLLTYADLITLLLAFFIVMYSMSSLDSKKFGKMADALNGILKGGASIVQTTGSNPQSGPGILDLSEFQDFKQEIDQSLSEHHLNDKIQTIQDERGLVIRVMETAAFDPGKADLKPELLPVLKLIVRDLSTMSNYVRVEGHTDNTPIHTQQYPSNWELSTDRATRVVRYMVEELDFDPKRASALGYAKYRPIAANDTPEGRARNRRVDIIVLAEGNTRFEPGTLPLPQRIALADSLLKP